MRHAKWIVPAALLVVVVAVAMAGDMDGLPDWLGPLNTPDGVTRDAAINTLAQQPSRLDDCLDWIEADIAPALRASIAEAVSRMTLAPSDVESVPALLDSTRPEVRGAGLRILIAHAGTSPARASLAQVAADPRELTTLRTMAAGGLAGAGGSALANLRALLAADDTPPAVRLVAVRALVRVSPDGISDAAGIAGDTTADRLEREVAIQALGTQGESGVTALQTLTGASEGWARTAVVAALTATGSPSAVPTFATKLGDPAALVRWNALQGLVTQKAIAANRTAIAKLMGDTDARVQVLAIQCVGATYQDKPKAVTTTLKGLLASPSFPVRRAAALALLALHSKAGLATMQADALSANPSQAALATAAVNQILAASW